MVILKRVLLALGLVIGLCIAALCIALSYDKPCPETLPYSGDGEKMTAVLYQCYGPPEVLQLAKLPIPTPAPDQVLVRIHSAGINPMDWHRMRGSPYFLRLMTGLGAPNRQRLGADFSGEVVKVGGAVTRFNVGDAVFGTQTGAYGEYVLVGENGSMVQKPDNVPFEQAGVVGVAGVTALQALQDLGQLKTGEKVLINGASGGVGTYAVQIARAMGATVTGVSSERNHALIRSLGASKVIDYRTTNYTEGEVRYDLVVDMVGNYSPLEISRVLEPGGRLVLVGGPNGDWLIPLRNPVITLVQAPFMAQEVHSMLARMSAEHLGRLAGMMENGQVVPSIGHRFPLARIREAIALSETGRARGKILIEVENP